MNYVEGDFGTMTEGGAGEPVNGLLPYQEHKRVLRAGMAALKACPPQRADGPFGLKALLACVSAPTDPRGAEADISDSEISEQAYALAAKHGRDPLGVEMKFRADEIAALKNELQNTLARHGEMKREIAALKAEIAAARWDCKMLAEDKSAISAGFRLFGEHNDALQQENAALRERLAAAEGWGGLSDVAGHYPGLDAALQRFRDAPITAASPVLDKPITELSQSLARALSLPNTTDAYGR